MLGIDHSSRAIEEFDTLQSKLLTLYSQSQLHIFCNIVQLQDVGTENYISNQMTPDISIALSNLKPEFEFKGKLINLTPDDLYRRYIQLLPLLSSNVISKSFKLSTLFPTLFLLTCKILILKEGYILPTFSLLTSKTLQAVALQSLRKHAVLVH